MKIRAFTRWLLLLVLLPVMAGCGSSTDLSRADNQEDFGVRMARMNLWREALFRFTRAVEMNPGDAMARNNLAVAYEANGDFERARTAYLEALKLDKGNQYIQKNYSRFVEFLSRDKKRQRRDSTTTAKPATAAAPGTAPTAPDATAPPAEPPAAAPAPAPPPPTSTQGGL